MKSFILNTISLAIIIMMIAIMLSCDRLYTNQLYIINNCNEPIHISTTNTWNTVDTFSVEANTTFMFNEGSGIVTPKGLVETSYVKFEVFKNGVLSKVNYRDFSKWIYVETTDKYHSEMYLPINPKDFE